MIRLQEIFTSERRVSALSLVSCLALCLTASSASAQALPAGGALLRPNVVPVFGGTAYDAAVGAAPSAATGYTLIDSSLAGGNPYNYTPGLPSEQFSGSVITKVWQKNSTGQLAFTYVFDNIVPPIGTGGPATSDILALQIEETSNAWHGVHITQAGADSTGGKSTAASGGINWTDGTPLSMSFEQSSSTSGIAVDFSEVGLGTELRQPSANNPDTSAIVWFQTDATKYLTAVVTDLNDPVGTTRVFAPVVPEPATLVLVFSDVLAACSCFGDVGPRRNMSERRVGSFGSGIVPPGSSGF